MPKILINNQYKTLLSIRHTLIGSQQVYHHQAFNSCKSKAIPSLQDITKIIIIIMMALFMQVRTKIAEILIIITRANPEQKKLNNKNF